MSLVNYENDPPMPFGFFGGEQVSGLGHDLDFVAAGGGSMVILLVVVDGVSAGVEHRSGWFFHTPQLDVGGVFDGDAAFDGGAVPILADDRPSSGVGA